MLKNRKGADTLLTVYLFAIMFIVAGAVVYMAFLFYGSPFDMRNTESRVMADQIANCLTNKGYLNEQVFTADFQKNFLSDCKINLSTEDYSDWKTTPQYYLEIQLYKFSPNQQTYGETGNTISSIYGDKVVDLTFGNPNLRINWEISQPKPGFFSFITPKRTIDTVVIHATEGADAMGAIQAIHDRGLSINYLIDRDGRIISSSNINQIASQYSSAFKQESDTAQHAGCIDSTTNAERPTCTASCVLNGLITPTCQSYNNPASTAVCCIEGFNPKSIGIELVNLGDACTDKYYRNSKYCPDSVTAYGKQWQNYTEAQMNALMVLVSNIASRYNIPFDRDHIIGHDQIAAFKQDPGPQFPWDNFMQALSARGAVASQNLDPITTQGQQQRSFYSIDRNGNKYIVQILTLVDKQKKNVK